MHVSLFAKIALCIGGLSVLAGCDLPAPQNRFEKIASTYCECTAGLAAVNKKANTAQPGELNAYFQEMQTEYAKAKECAVSIVAQFGHLKTAELDSVNTLLVTQCPGMAGHPDLLREMLGE